MTVSDSDSNSEADGANEWELNVGDKIIESESLTPDEQKEVIQFASMLGTFVRSSGSINMTVDAPQSPVKVKVMRKTKQAGTEVALNFTYEDEMHE